MLRCVRLYTDDSGESCFEEGVLSMPEQQGVTQGTLIAQAKSISFRETSSGGSFDWHTAPTYQFVLTLKGTLEFETRRGERFTIYPGDVLLAGDLTGGGHRWHLVDEQPWCRAYVALDEHSEINFIPNSSTGAQQ